MTGAAAQAVPAAKAKQPVHLRPAVPLDAGAIGAILSGFMQETDWMPRLHTGAETIAFAGTLIDRGWTHVAEQDRRVLGFLARDGEEVHALYLHRGARRAGIGGRLLDQAKAAQPRLALWCFQGNTAAQAFYLAQRFHETDRTDGAGNDEGLPDIRYVWERTPHG